jgi:hypothetical protein
LAPEKAVADPHNDHRATFMRLGFFAYEMLTAIRRSEAALPGDTLGHVTQATSQWLSGVEFTRAVAELVLKSLKKTSRSLAAAENSCSVETMMTPAPRSTRPRQYQP